MATNGLFIRFGPFFTGGSLATSAKIYHYVTGTTTDKDMWSDRAKTTTVAQPLVADSNGVATAFADGIYRIVVKDSSDNTLYTWDNVNIVELDTVGEGSALTAASTLTLGTDGNYFHVTGSTGITAISGTQPVVWLTFDSTPALTHSGNLILPYGQNHTMTAGETAWFVNDGSGVWRMGGSTLIANPLTTLGDTVYGGTTGKPTRLAGNTAAITKTLVQVGTGSVSAAPMLLSQLNGLGFHNLKLHAAVSGSTLVISLKGEDGNDPSATNPVSASFRSSTATNGAPNPLTRTSALSTTLPNGAEVGAVNNVRFRLWVLACEQAGAIADIGVFNTQGTSQLFPLPDETSESVTPTAVGTGSDSAGVFYATNATASRVRVIGFVELTLTSVGDYSTATVHKVQTMGPGVPLSGDTRRIAFDTHPAGSGTSSATLQDTGSTVTFTPSSAVALVIIEQADATAGFAGVNAAETFRMVLKRDAATLLDYFIKFNITNSPRGYLNLPYAEFLRTSSSVTYKTQWANDGSAGTVTIQAGGICVREVFA